MSRRAHILVLGNEKGGSGKSTTAMHVVVGLMQQGYRVGCLDLDGRQRTLDRYLDNRAAAIQRGAVMQMPLRAVVRRSEAATKEEMQAEERGAFLDYLEQMMERVDVVVIDCPGSDNFLSRLAHGCADTLVTPVNDSFIDLDLLAHIEPETNKVLGPSVYSEIVWDARKRRAGADAGTIDWVVLRNRVSSLDARNKRRVGSTLEHLAKRINFRIIPGLSERVIYRELFLEGLTMLDLGKQTNAELTMSQVAARAEVRALILGLKLVDRGVRPGTGAAPAVAA
ncbi:division plane positioning ATPase MipZ [Zavarzinia sp. CC-PAN008]|uniref:division plane positioning ATPase MipZ n=1 Tax=Zavarzinia sp. CC-PAN008 TaxID=3243332 RepID=UPI003F744254